MLRIAIVTTGRFHVCDLARELAARGHEVKFYSLVPPWRTRRFGLPKECNRWMLPRVAVKAAAMRFARSEAVLERSNQKLVKAYDRAVAKVIEPCDVLIGMSGMCNQVSHAVKEKYGAQIWIERGSRHIESQRDILAAIPGATRVSDVTVRRELADYEQADRIAVLSRHCEESFLERGFSPERLVRNPLGVNLKVFTPTDAPPPEPPTIIMTGIWCLRKGCDTLVEAWRLLPGSRLIHVGPVTDCRLPEAPRFVHHDRVEQNQLINFYAKAHVFALASREEGLATVQPQALACGLRLVCTTRTGGEDLKQFVTDDSAISVVQPGDASALAVALKSALDKAVKENGKRERMSAELREELTWAAYARRYEEAIFDSLGSVL